MSDALISMPEPKTGGPATGSYEAVGVAAIKPVREARGPISAASFKLLTARLKGGAAAAPALADDPASIPNGVAADDAIPSASDSIVAVEPLDISVSPVPAPELSDVDAVADVAEAKQDLDVQSVPLNTDVESQPGPAMGAELEAMPAPAIAAPSIPDPPSDLYAPAIPGPPETPDISIPAVPVDRRESHAINEIAAAPPPTPSAFGQPAFVEMPADVAEPPPPAVELPQFSPLQWGPVEPVPQEVAEAVEIESVIEPEGEYGEASADGLGLHDHLDPVAADANEGNPTGDVVDADPPAFSECAAESAEPAKASMPMSEPAAATEAEADTILEPPLEQEQAADLFGDMNDSGDAGNDPAPATTPEVKAEATAEPQVSDVPEPAADPFAAVDVQADVTGPDVASAENPAADVPVNHAPIPPAVLPPSVESAPEPKSELAGKVVDAMMKTISTAIYAKPSAAERAAFLREMAALMEAESIASGAAAQQAAAASEDKAVAELAPVDLPPALASATGSATIELPDAPPPDDQGAEPIVEALANRMGAASPLLKQRTEAEDEDPFAGPAKRSLLEEPMPAETAQADGESGELALTLLDMMSGGSGSALPQERTLAADTLLRILPRIPVKQLLAVVERVAIMESPPPLLVAKLIRDTRPEVVGPLLERCSHISDQDLMNAAPTGDAVKLRMMARRRMLSTVLSDYLISTGEPNVLLTLIRNPGASLSHDAFYKLAEQANEHQALLAPLATRADLPPPVAFELFWHVPPELRRFIFSRFLTDSETLNKILRITLATHGMDRESMPSDTKFPARELVDQALASAASYKLEESAQQLAEIGGVDKETALRILSDREGEPIAVLLKALGYPRSQLDEALNALRQAESGLLRVDRKPDELQAIFDSLSFNKARILLTYWDWFVRKAGPYAPHN